MNENETNQAEQQRKDYNEIHKARIEAIKAKVLGSKIYDQITLKGMDETKLDAMLVDMGKIIGREIFSNFYFPRVGKIVAILQTLEFNQQHKDALFQITGLTELHVAAFRANFPNFPFESKVTGLINYGRKMSDAESARDTILYAAGDLGVVVNDGDLSDITNERVETIYNNLIKRLENSVNFKQEVKETVPEQYDE